MTPETRRAIEDQCRYITSDSSIVANIQALHDRDVTLRDVARIRARLTVLRPKGRAGLSYGSVGPVVGPGEREFVVRAVLADCNRRFVRRMVAKGQVASWPALAAWADRHGDAELAKAVLERAA